MQVKTQSAPKSDDVIAAASWRQHARVHRASPAVLREHELPVAPSAVRPLHSRIGEGLLMLAGTGVVLALWPLAKLAGVFSWNATEEQD